MLKLLGKEWRLSALQQRGWGGLSLETPEVPKHPESPAPGKETMSLKAQVLLSKKSAVKLQSISGKKCQYIDNTHICLDVILNVAWLNIGKS